MSNADNSPSQYTHSWHWHCSAPLQRERERERETMSIWIDKLIGASRAQAVQCSVVEDLSLHHPSILSHEFLPLPRFCRSVQFSSVHGRWKLVGSKERKKEGKKNTINRTEDSREWSEKNSKRYCNPFCDCTSLILFSSPPLPPLHFFFPFFSRFFFCTRTRTSALVSLMLYCI